MNLWVGAAVPELSTCTRVYMLIHNLSRYWSVMRIDWYSDYKYFNPEIILWIKIKIYIWHQTIQWKIMFHTLKNRLSDRAFRPGFPRMNSDPHWGHVGHKRNNDWAALLQNNNYSSVLLKSSQGENAPDQSKYSAKVKLVKDLDGCPCSLKKRDSHHF